MKRADDHRGLWCEECEKPFSKRTSSETSWRLMRGIPLMKLHSIDTKAAWLLLSFPQRCQTCKDPVLQPVHQVQGAV